MKKGGKSAQNYELVCLLNVEGDNKTKYERLLSRLQEITGSLKVERAKDREGKELKHCLIKNFVNGTYFAFNFSLTPDKTGELNEELKKQGRDKQFFNRYTLLNLVNVKNLKIKNMEEREEKVPTKNDVE